MSVDEDQRVARRAAVATMVVGLAIVVLGPVIWAVDLVALLAGGAKPNMPDGPGVSTIDQWRGLMPVVVPWWVLLAVPLLLAGLVAVTWAPSRHLPATLNRGILLKVGPGFLAFWALLAAVVSLSSGVWYERSGYGQYWIPAALAAIVFLVAIARWLLLRRTGKTARSRRSRRARSN